MSDTNKNPQSPKLTNKTKNGGRFFTGVIAFLALLLACTGIAAGYYAWLELNKRIDHAAVDRQSIAHEIATIDENIKLQGFKKQVQQGIEKMDQQLVELSNQMEQQAILQERVNESAQRTFAHVNRSQLGWGLKEVEHILRMANHRLRIERDVAGAITALNAANTRVQELSDERLLPVRESISKQVGKLKNFPYPDWVGISLQLDNTISGLRKNLIKDAKQHKSDAQISSNSQAINNEQESEWKKFIADIKNSLSNSVKITREDQKLKLFISQQEKQHAYEFLRMKLLGTKYAVASRDNDSYHRELEAALAWLENTDTINNRNNLISELKDLSSINLEPELPDISEPRILLINIMDTIEKS